MKVYTVKELHEELGNLVTSGLGDRIVLVPDYENENIDDASYRTIGFVCTNDISKKCIYLEYNNDEEERIFWEYIKKQKVGANCD